MVINDLDIEGISIVPYEADSPLVVYSYAVLAFPGTFQLFKVIARRNLQVVETDGSMYLKQLSQRNALDFRGNPFRPAPVEDTFRFLRAKTQDHKPFP